MAEALRMQPHTVVIAIPATVAAGASETWGGFLAQYPGQIVAAELVNAAAVTANATNYTTITVEVGSTAAATLSTATTSLTADTPSSLTVSSTAANRKFAKGDNINVKKADTGTGAAITAPAYVAIHLIHGYEA